MSIVVSMKFKKSTKGTHVFEATDEQVDPPITVLYIRKTGLAEPAQMIKVTVDVL